MLQTYAGRDKLMRTVSYAGMLVAGVSKDESKLGRDLGTIARQVSAARTVGRLFDDFLMLSVTKGYGLGSHERDPITRVLQLLSNLSNQVFFPCEHIAWAADNEILPFKSTKWWPASIGCWALSLFFGILKSLRMISRFHVRRARLLKQRKLESPDKSGEADTAFRKNLTDLRNQEINEYINVLKNGSDLGNAVSWLPAGFLWAGKLSRGQNGLLGTVSSVLGLYQLIMSQKVKTS